jgi:hypothetical protein
MVFHAVNNDLGKGPNVRSAGFDEEAFRKRFGVRINSLQVHCLVPREFQVGHLDIRYYPWSNTLIAEDHWTKEQPFNKVLNFYLLVAGNPEDKGNGQLKAPSAFFPNASTSCIASASSANSSIYTR